MRLLQDLGVRIYNVRGPWKLGQLININFLQVYLRILFHYLVICCLIQSFYQYYMAIIA